jgi:hypothetical protein
MKKLITAAILLVMATMSANAQLVINELMQSNVECIMDDIHEFPDSWVELYNKGTERVNLGDYKIGTNKKKVDKAWQLPEIYLDPDSYIIIYCDKEDGDDHPLHASFRLDSDKEGNLYLFQDNEIVNSVEGIPIMPAPDIAYGHVVINDVDTWGYELKSTPGAANEGGVVAADQILGAPVFSHKGRVDNTAFNLTLSLPEGAPEGTVICYTTDGSEPTAIFNSETNCFEPTGSSKLYNAPVNNINSTTVVRAKLFHKDYLSPVSTAQSYIFRESMTVPIISIQTKNSYLNDDDIGIFTNNINKYQKVDWRRPINIEMFDATGKSVINQLGETRIQGGKSRENDLQSMAIYANKRFDADKKRFSYEFFHDQKPDIKEFKSFSLRDGGNDFTDLYFRDLIIQRTMGQNTDIDWQAGHTAVLYINGEYMGMLNIRERSNADNIYSNYDGLEDIDMIEISHEDATGVDEFIEELKEGDLKKYDAFKAFYSEPNHTLAEYEEWLDVSEYLNIVIMNLFYGNNDWPGNNTVFWRPRTDAGRWRVIAKDTDFGLGLYGKSNSYNMIDLLYNPQNHSGDKWAFTEPATRLIKNMLKDPDILNLFIDKCCVFMGDFMNGTGTGEIIDKIQAEALEEFVAHRQLYPSYGGNSRDQITGKFNNAKNWAQGRPNYFINHLKSKWNLGTARSVTINKEVDATNIPDEVLVNGIKLTKGVFDGKLFEGRQITLEGKTNNGNGLSVTKWKIKTTVNGRETTTYSNGPTYTFNVPSCTKLSINAVMVDKPEVNIGQRGAVSYSSTKALDFTDLPVEAYIVTAKNGNSFNKKQVYKVPAETGLVVEGAEGTYKIPVAVGSQFDDFSGNLLQSTATAAFTVPDDGNAYYGLFYSTTKNRVGFQKKSAGFTFGQGKSYLKLSGAMAKSFNEIFFEGATAIQGVYDDAWTDGKTYNLNGQRVDKNYKGVMIVNGKKVVNNQK